MKTPLRLKVKVALVLAVSMVIFATAGWSLAHPWAPGGAMTVVLHYQPLRLALVLLALTVATTVLAMVIGRPYARHLGFLAVPSGLFAWSVMSGTMDELLVKHYELADRCQLFYSLVGDVTAWFALVLLGCLITLLFTTESSSDGLAAVPAAAKRSHPKEKQSILSNPTVRNTVAVGLTCVLSVLLLKLLAQSGRVKLETQPVLQVGTVPARGQIIFAVAAAFLISTVVAHQLFATTPLWCFLPAPPVVATIAYFSAAQGEMMELLLGVSARFVPVSLTFATVLPVQYMGVGELAVIGGYWFSVRWLRKLGKRGAEGTGPSRELTGTSTHAERVACGL